MGSGKMSASDYESFVTGHPAEVEIGYATKYATEESVGELEKVNAELQTIQGDIKKLMYAIDRLTVCMLEMTGLIKQVATRCGPGDHRGKDNDDSR